MDDDETLRQMRVLYARAEDYAFLACEHLWLEMTHARSSPIDESAVTDLDAEGLQREMFRKLNDFAITWAQSNPVKHLHEHYSEKLVIHFLFPNLSPEERLIIEAAVTNTYWIVSRSGQEGSSHLEEGLQAELANARKAIESFENKLATVQMALVDSQFCNPDSDVWYT